MTVLSGRVWKYGDDVNTDVIFPGKYTYTASGRDEIASHALEDLDPGFVDAVQPGDIIVAGRNWGCGSSREQAATCLAYNGVGAIIAASYGRIFYRNALNNGLMAIVSPQASQLINAGETVQRTSASKLIPHVFWTSAAEPVTWLCTCDGRLHLMPRSLVWITPRECSRSRARRP